MKQNSIRHSAKTNGKKAVVLALCAALLSPAAFAGKVTDKAGNEGYDTLDECAMAIATGTAKFYRSHTTKPPLLRKGEKSSKVMTLREVPGRDYGNGTCDVGVGHSGGRDGVSSTLQGKYVPYSPDMKVNAYSDSQGKIVRVTMQQCDNNFSDSLPTNLRRIPKVTPPTPPVVPPVAPPVAPPVVPPVAPPVVPPVAPPVVPPAVAPGAGVVGAAGGLGTYWPALLLLGAGIAAGAGGTTTTTTHHVP